MDGLRLWGYVHNPITWIDPLGLDQGGCDEEYNYAPTEKHKPGRWGTEMDLDDDTAQKVLNESIQGGGKK